MLLSTLMAASGRARCRLSQVCLAIGPSLGLWGFWEGSSRLCPHTPGPTSHEPAPLSPNSS